MTVGDSGTKRPLFTSLVSFCISVLPDTTAPSVDWPPVLCAMMPLVSNKIFVCNNVFLFLLKFRMHTYES